MSYGEAMKHVKDALTSVGVNAEVDPSDLADLPGAWVEPASMKFNYLDGGTYDATMTVLLVVPDNGVLEAMANLTELVDLARQSGLPVDEVTFTRAVLENHASDPLPACRFTTTLQVEP